MLDLNVVYSLGNMGNTDEAVQNATGRLIIGLRHDLVGPHARHVSHAGAGVIGNICTHYLEPVLREHGILLTISDAARARIAEDFVQQMDTDRNSTGYAITDEGRKTLLFGIMDAAINIPAELRENLKQGIERKMALQHRLAPDPSHGTGAAL